MKKPLALIIMDGYRLSTPTPTATPWKAADAPHLHKIFTENPCTAIGASGMDVGLPDGRWATVRLVTPTSVPAVSCIRSLPASPNRSPTAIFQNPALLSAMEAAKKPGRCT